MGVESRQADLGIEVILKVFSKDGLEEVFTSVEEESLELAENTYRLYIRRRQYLRTIDPVIQFLQYGDPTLAHNICTRSYLP